MRGPSRLWYLRGCGDRGITRGCFNKDKLSLYLGLILSKVRFSMLLHSLRLIPDILFHKINLKLLKTDRIHFKVNFKSL